MEEVRRLFSPRALPGATALAGEGGAVVDGREELSW